MRCLTAVLFVSVVMLGSGLTQVALHSMPHRAPTYYLAADAVSCNGTMVRAYGASNLPPGAVIAVVVTDFVGDGWHDDSDDAFAEIDNKGFFRTEIHPKLNTQFHRNSLLRASFAPYRPKQSNEVLRIVGRKGENLGGLENPQVFQVSGPNYGLETIARVPYCGEGIDGVPAR